MKLFLAVLLFVGAALSNSTHRYGWQPQREFVYRYDSKVDFNIPEIRANHKAGLRLTSVLRIQAKNDYSLLIKFDQPKFLTFSGLQGQERREEHEEPIPQAFRQHLEKPFLVRLRRGVVEDMIVERDEPVTVTNIKKAVLSTLTMDLSAFRRNEILSNRLEAIDEQSLEESPVDQSYFTTREQSLHGDCQTSYNVHPLPDFEAMEVEERMEQEEQRRNSVEHLQGGLSQGREACQGKKYWQIIKTTNFDNCKERPIFQKWNGIKSQCDTTKNVCKDLMTHMHSTTYLVCGNDVRDFAIRKALTNEMLATTMGWKTDEQMKQSSQVVFELLKIETVSSFYPEPQNKREIKSLTFEYPKQKMTSQESLNQELSEQEKEQIEQETGIRPILPKPDLRSAPKMLVPVTLQKSEVTRQVIEQLEKVAQEIFESPESCTSKGDVAGTLHIVAKALRPLSFTDLKEVESRLESQISSRPQKQRKVIRGLFYDVVSMIGTNPAVMLVKERVRDTSRIDSLQAVAMIQTTVSNIRTPTQELLKELIKLVKEDLKQLSHDRTQVYNVGMIQLSNLLHRACVNPEKRNQYPEQIYGAFCHRDAQPVVEYLEFLENEMKTQQNQQIKLNTVTAIGKLGHIRSVQILSAVISHPQYNEMVRSLAVYNLQRAAKMQPAHVKPILLKIIDNAAEAEEVRIAAVAVLPYAQPTTAELQKIAVRTWLEPSKEVSSFIYSTFKSLTTIEVPELKAVGQRVTPLMSLIKPEHFGLHYAKNFQSSQFVPYLQMVINQENSWTKSKDSIVPRRYSWNTQVYGGVYQVNGPSYTFYTRNMDKWIDTIMKYTRKYTQASQQVEESLRQITEKLSIEKRQQQGQPELFQQAEVFDFEAGFYLNDARVVEAMQQLADQLNNDIHSLTEKKHIELTKATKVLDAEGLGPCAAGFPVYVERTIPVVMALKAESQLQLEEQGSYKLPKKIMGKLVPVVNVKMEANMGVISPFNEELIGTGVELALHYATPLEMTVSRQLTQITLDIKLPEEITRELEIVHVFVTPFTVKKDLRRIEPVSKGRREIILSGEPLKEMNLPIGQALEIDAKIIAKSDARFNDIASYWEKIRQHNSWSLVNSFYLPSSIRMSSLKVKFNPQQSRTREVSFTMGLVKLTKQHGFEQGEAIPPMMTQDPVEDMNHIKQVCIETFPKSPAQFSECVLELTAIEMINDSVDSMCKIHNFPRCQKLEGVCHKAMEICERKSGLRTQECRKSARTCMERVLNLQAVHKTLKQLNDQGTVIGLRLDAQIPTSRKAISTSIAFGFNKESSTPKKETIKMVSNVEVKTSESPVYEVKLVSKAEVPRVSNRWNKNQLVEEALQLILNGEMEYGYENRQKQSIKMKSQMIKSAEQKESVKRSPEFARCTEEEQMGRQLSNVCEFSRHQAASIDEVIGQIELPKSFYRYPMLIRIGEAVKSYFIGQIWEYESSHTSEAVFKLKAKVNRVGDEAQVTVELAGRKYEIVNIRLPQAFKGILPVSVRNPLSYNIMQKITKHQIPASCRVEPSLISTFDNRTYGYELNDCYHLLFKDCSENIPVAVLAKNVRGQQKQVKILSGLAEVEMIPQGSSLQVKINVQGRQEELRIQPGQVKKIRDQENQMEIMEVKRYEDNVYLINAFQESLWVLFNGERIEISGSYMLRSRSCGLCGDLNGENTADLRTPKMCVMSRPRYAAYSYMMEESCQGIPSQDKSEYQREKSECIKARVIPTPLEKLTQIVASKASQVTKPILSQHLVQKQHDQTCISVQKVKVCSKINMLETEEPKPAEVRRKLVQYVCYDSASQIAQQLEQRAMSGETLDVKSAGKSVAFGKIEYEPVVCQRQSNQI